MILVIVRNPTLVDHEYQGRAIFAGTSYTLLEEEKDAWAADPEVTDAITKGELVVNDGTEDLHPEDGLLRLQAKMEANLTLFKNAEFNAKTADEGIVEAATKCTGVVGICQTLAFVKAGDLGTSCWLGLFGVPAEDGDNVPGIVGYTSRLRMLTYSNAVNADCDIEIYAANPNYGLSNPKKIASHVVRRSRVGFQALDVEIPAGTKIGVLAVGKGVHPQSIAVTLTTQVISAVTLETLEESFDGGFLQWT